MFIKSIYLCYGFFGKANIGLTNRSVECVAADDYLFYFLVFTISEDIVEINKHIQETIKSVEYYKYYNICCRLNGLCGVDPFIICCFTRQKNAFDAKCTFLIHHIGLAKKIVAI